MTDVDLAMRLAPHPPEDAAEEVVRADALSKRYGGTQALVDVSLTVRRGEVFAYLGPNGAGKTTTLRILLGLIRPTSGSASVLGLDAWQDSVAVHRRVGYVPGDVAFPRRTTGRQLVRYLGRLRGRDELHHAAELAERLELDLDRRIEDLSKGNRQKVALVQALMARPSLLVLDEPTTGLDPLVQQQVHDLLREHVDHGGTVLLSSHVLSEVQRIADRVGIIRAGSLVAVERLDDLRSKSLHHVELRFDRPVDATPFAAVPGVRDVHVHGTHLTCRASQDALDAVVKRAAEHHVVDLACEEASLEDMFLTFYAGGR